MTNKNQNHDAFEFLSTGDHRIIIYSALKQLGIRHYDDRYEDFVQEGWLLFVDIFQKYPDDPWLHPKPFLAYARLALYRRFLNMVTRPAATRENVQEKTVVDEAIDAAALNFDMEQAILEASQLTALLEACDIWGQRFIIDRLENNLSISAIAKKWHVSRQTVYKWRQKVQAALTQLN